VAKSLPISAAVLLTLALAGAAAIRDAQAGDPTPDRSLVASDCLSMKARSNGPAHLRNACEYDVEYVYCSVDGPSNKCAHARFGYQAIEARGESPSPFPSDHTYRYGACRNDGREGSVSIEGVRFDGEKLVFDCVRI
jgi:hypothetical protein